MQRQVHVHLHAVCVEQSCVCCYSHPRRANPQRGGPASDSAAVEAGNARFSDASQRLHECQRE